MFNYQLTSKNVYSQGSKITANDMAHCRVFVLSTIWRLGLTQWRRTRNYVDKGYIVPPKFRTCTPL